MKNIITPMTKSGFIKWYTILILAAMGIAYFGIQHYMEQRTEVMYCGFDVDVNDTLLPRHECGVLKIVSKDMDEVNFKELFGAGAACHSSKEQVSLKCADSESYHFAKFSLSHFCEYVVIDDETNTSSIEDCGAHGVVCKAVGIKYGETFNPNWKYAYESDYFTHPNIKVKEMVQLLEECDA